MSSNMLLQPRAVNPYQITVARPKLLASPAAVARLQALQNSGISSVKRQNLAPEIAPEIVPEPGAAATRSGKTERQKRRAEQKKLIGREAPQNPEICSATRPIVPPTPEPPAAPVEAPPLQLSTVKIAERCTCASETRAILVRLWPDIFGTYRPLAIDIHKELQAANVRTKSAKVFLKNWTARVDYLIALATPGAHRVHLDGSDAGEVPEEAQEKARTHIISRWGEPMLRHIPAAQAADLGDPQ